MTHTRIDRHTLIVIEGEKEKDSSILLFQWRLKILTCGVEYGEDERERRTLR